MYLEQGCGDQVDEFSFELVFSESDNNEGTFDRLMILCKFCRKYIRLAHEINSTPIPQTINPVQLNSIYPQST